MSKAAPKIHFENVYRTIQNVAMPKAEPVNLPQDRNEDKPVADFPDPVPWAANPNSTASTGNGGVIGASPETPPSS